MDDKEYIKIEISNKPSLQDVIILTSGLLSVTIMMVTMIIFCS